MEDAIGTDVTSASQQLSALAPGDVDWTGKVLGEFRLLRRIGRGGMGQVYLAEQTNLKRKVALKLLHPELAGNEQSLLRFKAEAENVARATHANIVQIYTIGQAEGVNYLALEYVEGKNLREFIEKKGTPDLPLGLHIMTQVGSALQRASELGIIHRDIKPENILLTQKGEVKVADFGLSRCFAEEGGQSITQSQITMGTPLYMSPEQVERKPVDTRTDIYSFGVTCFHMFAGTPPFRGTSPIEIAYQHVHKDAPQLAEIRPDLPAELCAVIQKMMAKRPEDRYQSAREIVRDIGHLRDAMNLGVVAAISMSSPILGVNADSASLSATQTWPSLPVPSPWPGRAVKLTCVLGALVIGSGIGKYVYHRPQSPAPQEEATPEKKPTRTPEDEKEMQRQVQEYLAPSDHNEVVTGFTLAVKLGLHYLKDKRLEEADKFFLDLSKPERKLAFRQLGRTGHAAVLAFKDESAASNQEFVAVISDFEKTEARFGGKVPKLDRPTKKDLAGWSEEIEAYQLWRGNSAFRELVARAMQRNYLNDPESFAEKQPAERLNAYRFPPRPVVKAQPAP